MRLNRLSARTGIFSVFLLASVAPAAAQNMCGDRGEVIKDLSKGYEEAPSAMGIAANGALFEVLTSGSGTWSILMTLPTRGTCIVATGEAWEEIKNTAMGESGI
jgi:hypothetical protein